MSRSRLVRPVALGFGAAFGFLISWGGLANPDLIRRMLLLEDGYIWWMFFCAVGVAFVGLRLLRASHRRSLLTNEVVSWTTRRPDRRCFAGAALFGAGWALSDACPGPIAAQLGQGLVWSLFTFAGVWVGVSLFLRRERRTATAPDALAAAVSAG